MPFQAQELETARHEQAESCRLLAHWEESYSRAAMEIRTMRATILRLRGNVQVFARVRQHSDCDALADIRYERHRAGTHSISLPRKRSDLPREAKAKSTRSENEATVRRTAIASPVRVHTDKDLHQELDFVFDSCARNEDVFNETAEVLHSVLEGDQAVIMAYGYTGSGKSHTMVSSDGL